MPFNRIKNSSGRLYKNRKLLILCGVVSVFILFSLRPRYASESLGNDWFQFSEPIEYDYSKEMVCREDSKVPLVILKTGKSGSTFLLERLNNHPNIELKKELKSIRSMHETLLDSDDETVRGFSVKSPRTYTAGIDEFVELLKYHSPRLVLLLRRNSAKAAISRLGEHSYSKDADRVRDFDPNEVLSHANQFSKINSFIFDLAQRSGLPYIFFYYEDIQRDTPLVIRTILTFLGFDPDDYTKHIEAVKDVRPKRNPEDLREIITNFDDVQSKLSTTCYRDNLLADYCSPIKDQYCDKKKPCFLL